MMVVFRKMEMEKMMVEKDREEVEKEGSFKIILVFIYEVITGYYFVF